MWVFFNLELSILCVTYRVFVKHISAPMQSPLFYLLTYSTHSPTRPTYLRSSTKISMPRTASKIKRSMTLKSSRPAPSAHTTTDLTDGPPPLKRMDSRRKLNKTASRTGRGFQKLANISYERQWAKDRKHAYAGERIVHKVGFSATSNRNDNLCNCTICPCRHMWCARVIVPCRIALLAPALLMGSPTNHRN